MTKTDPLATDEMITLPCPVPWCRGQAEADWYAVGEQQHPYWVKCTKCGCKTPTQYATVREALAAWNTRSKEPQSTSPALPTDEITRIARDAVIAEHQANGSPSALIEDCRLGRLDDQWDARVARRALAMQAKAPATSPIEVGGLRDAIERKRREHFCSGPDCREYDHGIDTGFDLALKAFDQALSQSSSPVEVGSEALEPFVDHAFLIAARYANADEIRELNRLKEALSLQTKDNEEEK